MLYVVNKKQSVRCALIMFALTSPLAAHAAGPAPVNLGAAARFAILSKSGITDVPTSAVTGRVGTSPITGAADHLSCAEVTGWIFSVDAAGPAPNVTGLGAGNIGGLTIGPGVYKWGTGVLIPSDVTLQGSTTDTWIFQISQNLRIDAGKHVILKGGARARNIVWQIAGQTVIESTARFEGIVLCKTLIAMKTGASIRGRLLAQTAVTLEKNEIRAPQS
jgi:hypothetical protein